MTKDTMTPKEKILRDGLILVAERCEAFAKQAQNGLPFHKLPKQSMEECCPNHEEIRWLLGFATLARIAVQQADELDD
jgi:hypothetical protein